MSYDPHWAGAGPDNADRSNGCGGCLWIIGLLILGFFILGTLINLKIIHLPN